MRHYRTNRIRAMLWAMIVVLLSMAAGHYLSKYIQPKPPVMKQKKRDWRPAAPRVKIQPWIDQAKKYALV